jgi:hypothetical protein
MNGHGGLALVVVLGACSFGMRTVDHGWDGTTEPDCNDSFGPEVIDSLGAGVTLAIVLNTTQQTSAGIVIPALVGALAYTIGAGYGEIERRKCESAETIWQAGNAIGPSRQTNPVQVMPEFTPRPRPRPVVASVQRGFFCSVSTASEISSFCVRDKSACTAARDVAIGSVPDLHECELREAAWCFGERCAPLQTICDEQRKRAMGTDGVAPDCEETR